MAAFRWAVAVATARNGELLPFIRREKLPVADLQPQYRNQNAPVLRNARYRHISRFDPH